MRRIFLLSCMAACVLATASVQAEEWKLGGQVGGLTINDAENNQVLFGGHMELMLSNTFGIRGDVSYRSEEEFSFQSENVGDLSMVSTTLPITVSANLYIPLVVLQPYATAGIGWYVHDFEFSQDFLDLGEENHKETDVAWHLGVGTTLALAPKVDLFGEYRALFFGDDKSLDVVGDSVKDLDFTSHQITVGVSLKLGSKED